MKDIEEFDNKVNKIILIGLIIAIAAMGLYLMI